MVSYYSQLLFPEHFNYTSHSTKMKSAPQYMTWPTPLSSMVSRDLRMCKTLSKYRFFCDNICNAVFRTMPQSLGLKLNSECWRKKREKRASTDKLPQLLGTQRQRKPKFNYVKDDASLENQIMSMMWNQWQQEVNQLKEEISLRDDEIQKLQKGEWVSLWSSPTPRNSCQAKKPKTSREKRTSKHSSVEQKLHLFLSLPLVREGHEGTAGVEEKTWRKKI